MCTNAIGLLVVGGIAVAILAAPSLAEEGAVPGSAYSNGSGALSDEDLATLRGREDVSNTSESTATATADNSGTATSTSNSFNTSQNDEVNQDLLAENNSTFTGDNASTGAAYVGNAMGGMAGFANVLVNSGINSNLQGTIGVTINLH